MIGSFRHYHWLYLPLVLSVNREQALININRAIQYNSSVSNKIIRIRHLNGLGKADRAKHLKADLENELANDTRKKLIYGKQVDRVVIEEDQQENQMNNHCNKADK